MKEKKEFIYYLAAIGNPNFYEKIKFLNHNLNYLNAYYDKFDIFINCYDDSPIEQYINNKLFPFLDNIIISKKPGMLSELWINNPKHDLLKNYNYILFILDDIMLDNCCIPRLIEIKKSQNLQFISPIVKKATWEYMKNTYKNYFIKTKRLEIFCFLLTYTDFETFVSLNTIENCNAWGIDYIMSYKNISCGLSTNDVVTHKLPSKSNHKLAIIQCTNYLKKHGFSSISDFLNKYPHDI